MLGEVCGDMTDDEFLAQCEEDEKLDAELGWDTKKYLMWWQDPNHEPAMLLNIGELSRIIGKSEDAIDKMIKRGAPVYLKGGNGTPYQIDPAAFREWMIARDAGITIEELRACDLKDAERTEELFKARLMRIRNDRLAAQVEQLTAKVARLEHESKPARRRQSGKR